MSWNIPKINSLVSLFMKVYRSITKYTIILTILVTQVQGRRQRVVRGVRTPQEFLNIELWKSIKSEMLIISSLSIVLLEFGIWTR